NRKNVHNEVRIEALIIKKTDFDAVATSRNLDPEEAENLKFDQEHSIPDTMALKHQLLEKYNLSAESTPEQLSKHASELGASLPDWMERAKYCAKTDDKWDIFIHVRDIGPKSNDDKEIVTGCSRLSLFRNELRKAGVAQELIDTYAKDPNVTTASNKIQKERTDQILAENRLRTPIYFSIARLTLQILQYGMKTVILGIVLDMLRIKKDPERARTLLIWIQEAIKAGKLRDPTFSENGKCNTRAFSNFLELHRITRESAKNQVLAATSVDSKLTCDKKTVTNGNDQDLKLSLSIGDNISAPSSIEDNL
ncbi:4380_t:CDS:2, partial [Acaulospora colombiana]